jgi:hypothetical protein
MKHYNSLKWMGWIIITIRGNFKRFNETLQRFDYVDWALTSLPLYRDVIMV